MPPSPSWHNHRRLGFGASAVVIVVVVIVLDLRLTHGFQLVHASSHEPLLELVGLRVDDQLVEVNGVSVFSSNEPISTLLPKHGDQLILGIRRPPTTHEAAPPEPTSSQGQEVSLTASVTNGSRVDVHMELPRANAQPCSAVPTEHLPQQDGELKTASAPIPEPEGLEEMQQDQLGMRGGHERS